ncbi:MAG: FtsX-like permease family protein [Acidimicrobiia bacterium]
MWKATIRGVGARRVRLGLTALAVVLGVSLVAGTYVLTDTLGASLDQVFQQLGRGSDLVVRAPSMARPDSPTRPRLPDAVAEQLRGVPEVGDARGVVYGTAKLVDPTGRHVVRNGVNSAIGTSWTEGLGPLTVVSGRAPERAGEIVLDDGTVRRERFRLGGPVRMIITGGTQQFRLVGTVALGDRRDPSAISFFALDPQTAQERFDARGLADWIYVRARAGTSVEQAAQAIRDRFPELDVQAPSEFAHQVAQPTRVALGYVNDALLAFAAIGLFVGAFIIFNTFSILVQQRTRELALLRALGAGGRQVVVSVVVEATAVGVAGALAGLFLGIELARGLLVLVGAHGFRVPDVGLVVEPRTIVAALIVGLAVTVVAAIVPAVRAARTPPVVGIEDARPAAVAPLHRRAVIGTVVVALAVVTIAYGVTLADTQLGRALTVTGAGAFALFAGVVVVGPALAGPLARAVGVRPVNVVLVVAGGVVAIAAAAVGMRAMGDQRWPLAVAAGVTALGGVALAVAGPIAFGVLGVLARGNASRNPRRTSATALALVIGLTLVCVVSTFGASARASLRSSIDRSVRADLVISDEQFAGFPTRVARLAATTPGVAAASAVRIESTFTGSVGTGRAIRSTRFAGVDPTTIDRVVDLGYREGSARGLESPGILLSEREADALGVHVGDQVAAELPRSGYRQLPVVGVFRNNQFTGSITLDALVTMGVLSGGQSAQLLDTFVYVKSQPGRTAATRRELQHVLRDEFVRVDTRDQFRQRQEDVVGEFLNVLLALLAFSLVIAVVGIVNTLFLSVHERTRELGLLRVAGMSRRQVRRLIRGESVIVAMIGSVLGVAMGLVWGWALNRVLRYEGLVRFVVPVGQLAVYVVLAAIAGVVAALAPAWRAARLDVLEAIAQE